MKRKALLGSIMAIAAIAPAVIAPRVVHAQDKTATAEYPDVPRGHWAYDALNKLSNAGIVEGLPSGNYGGNKSMTRYEFAVAIARLLERIPTTAGGSGPPITNNVENKFDNSNNERRLDALEARPVPDITRAEVNDLIGALRREFADELARLGVRVDALENRVSNLENRVSAPPRLTITPSLLYRTGVATYISQIGSPALPAGAQTGPFGPGRGIVNGNNGFNGFGSPGVPAGTPNQLPTPPYVFFNDKSERLANEKYSYTDFELRLTDRITDRLSVVGALRSMSSTQEDNWAGDSGGNAYLREGYAVADLSDRSFIGIKGLNAILGRQRTKIGQGLLYDNDLQPTDQIQGQFGIGPFQINAFIGTNNNQLATGGGNPYLTTGAVANLGLGGTGGANNGDPFNIFFPAGSRAAQSGAAVGFSGNQASYADDNEAAVRAGFNLFRIAGQPVSLGVTRLFDGVQNQRGDSLDLTIPLFNRTIGVEYVRQRSYAGVQAVGNPKAYNVTVPLFRARALDLNFAYGKADDEFEYFTASSANPYARTYAEALFDRPLALGAPMINGRFFDINNPNLNPGVPTYAAAKEAFDFTGTLKVLRRLPLNMRYYKAYGSRLLGAGGRKNALDLGSVFTIGSTFNVSPGMDLELKYGQYNVPGNYPNIRYVRVGANVGF